MTREPCLLGCGNARLPATDCLAKGDNMEGNALRVFKQKFGRAGIDEAVLFAGNTVETPRAKPVIEGIAVS